VPCRVLRIGFTGELSYEVHCPSAFGMYVWQALMEAGEAHGIVPFGVEAQRVLRLEKAHVIVGQDTDALSDPLSADLGWAVKMEKDDFLGKRSLARISQKGIQHRLVGFQMAQPEVVPDEGLQIVQRDAHGKQEILGWVTSSKWSPTLKRAIGLCWVPVSLAEQEGAEFTIRMDGAFYEARVHHGAFYDPEGERVRM
ncbi:MAG: aminomethyltransferase family protein, partial [bacterium]|nr:aminomethyltransferase family protein [bacterium]